MVYHTSLDKRAIVLTILVTVLFLFFIITQYPIITNEGKEDAPYTTIACLLIYALAFGFRPVKYKISETEILICRPFVNARISLRDIQTIEVVNENTVTGSIRTFGVGGLFGYYGSFYNFSLGRMTWYATRKDKLVLVCTQKDKIVLTPDDAEQFVADVKQKKR